MQRAMFAGALTFLSVYKERKKASRHPSRSLAALFRSLPARGCRGERRHPDASTRMDTPQTQRLVALAQIYITSTTIYPYAPTNSRWEPLVCDKQPAQAQGVRAGTGAGGKRSNVWNETILRPSRAHKTRHCPARRLPSQPHVACHVL